MQISKEDAEKIRRLKAIMDKGFYASGEEVTELHNRILNTRLSSTNCSACIRQRITALVDTLNKQLAQEAKKAQELNNIKAEPKEEPTEAGNAPKPKRKKKV